MDSKPSYQKKPLIQVIGEKHFVLMELVPKENAVPEIQSRVYIGEGDRDVVDHVKHRISFNDLTHGSQLELPFMLENIILLDEQRYVHFFNDAHPITNRLHMLELLPGIGKKLMWAIIDERKKGNFTSLDEIHKRIGSLHSPQKIISHRIIDELKDENIKYRLFTIPPRRTKLD
jgi:putative nucleotide binding protein